MVEFSYLLNYLLRVFSAGSSRSGLKRKSTDDDREQPKRACNSFCFFVQAQKGSSSSVCGDYMHCLCSHNCKPVDELARPLS